MTVLSPQYVPVTNSGRPPQGPPQPRWTPPERFEVFLGRGDDGSAVCWDPHLDAHLLAMGRDVVAVGEVLRATAMGWAGQGCPVFACIGPALGEHLGLREWPNVQFVARTGLEQLIALHALHGEMERRRQALVEGHLDFDDLVPLLLLVDDETLETSTRQAVADLHHAPADPVEVTLDLVSSIAARGWAVRLHLIVHQRDVSARRRLGEFTNARAWVGATRETAGDLVVARGPRAVFSQREDRGRALRFDWFPCPADNSIGATAPNAPARNRLQQLRPHARYHEQLAVVIPELLPGRDGLDYWQVTTPQLQQSIRSTRLGALCDHRAWVLPRAALVAAGLTTATGGRA